MLKHASIFALLLLTGLSCHSLSPTAPRGTDMISVQTAINLSATGVSASSLSRMVLEVCGEDMDTLRTDLTVSGGYASGVIKVPAGESRTFTALGYQQDDLVLRGSTTVDLKKGEAIKVKIDLTYLRSTVILSPPRVTVAADSSFTLYLAARQVQKLAAFGARITFDPTYLKVTELGRENAFLTSNGGSITQMQFNRDNTLGHVDVVLGVFPAAKAVSGDGAIARMRFEPLKSGSTVIELHLDKETDADLGLYDNQAIAIGALALACTVTIQAAP